MFITARIRRMGKGNIFSLSTLAGRGGTPSQVWVGGYPIPGLGGGLPHPRSGWWGGGVPGVPSGQVWMVGGYLGYSPPARSRWGNLPPPIRQSSIASTCYTAGGMPLAFMQEDFLVFCVVKEILSLSEFREAI